MRSDIRGVLPEAGALVMAGFRHDGGEAKARLVQVVGDGVWHAWRMKAEAGDDGKSAERTNEPGERERWSRRGTIPAKLPCRRGNKRADPRVGGSILRLTAQPRG